MIRRRRAPPRLHRMMMMMLMWALLSASQSVPFLLLPHLRDAGCLYVQAIEQAEPSADASPSGLSTETDTRAAQAHPVRALSAHRAAHATACASKHLHLLQPCAWGAREVLRRVRRTPSPVQVEHSQKWVLWWVFMTKILAH